MRFHRKLPDEYQRDGPWWSERMSIIGGPIALVIVPVVIMTVFLHG